MCQLKVTNYFFSMLQTVRERERRYQSREGDVRCETERSDAQGEGKSGRRQQRQAYVQIKTKKIFHLHPFWVFACCYALAHWFVFVLVFADRGAFAVASASADDNAYAPHPHSPRVRALFFSPCFCYSFWWMFLFLFLFLFLILFCFFWVVYYLNFSTIGLSFFSLFLDK